MQNTITRENLSHLAGENGFFLSGTTHLEPAESTAKFVKWIEAGYHGSMAYLENNPGFDLRLNPHNLFPPARSIIFLGARYLKRELSMPSDPLHGIIASYAWGLDYHAVLRKRANQLVNDISSQVGRSIQHRITIDSAPVLEKPLSTRAGLGWQGRNTCLISPTDGSFFFIAGIFVDIDLEPCIPFERDYCGTCHRCVDACPTGCILPDRTLDARRCISYLTIEHKDVIPGELRPLMGNMIFGCDICQQVCPWNRKPDNHKVMDEFHPLSDWTISPDLRQLIAMQPQEFNQVYGSSPIQRAKRRGLLRNAAIALGNAGDPQSIPVLKTVLQTEIEPGIRLHAAWALGQINTPQAREVLSQVRSREADEAVLQEIKRILSN
jgi:epoxyqueuosine reductase